MVKKLIALAATLLAGHAAAASATVWSAADGNGTVPPVGAWYKYANATSDAATLSTTADGAKSVALTVSTTNESSAAGMGFAMAKTKATVDLSAYKGVCLTYSATQKFKFDIKQSSITDYDYNGVVVAAQASLDTLFIPFSSLAQEGWGTATAFDATLIEGMQFSYKQSIASDVGNTKNTIVVSAVSLGSSCTNHAPVLNAGLKDTLSIAEGAVESLNVADIFTDEDGDDLTVTVKIESASGSVVLVDSSAYNQDSAIKFTTVANPKDSATVTITATDSYKNTATYTFLFATEDVANAPVAKDMAITVLEDSSYKSPLTARVSTLGSDADGDKITFKLVSEPAHGTLTVESTGIFTYVPEKDFNGTDTFTYEFVEDADETSVSNVATCTITVTPVNDAPVVNVAHEIFVDELGNEHAFGDTIAVDEDFASFSILVPDTNITVTDVDGVADIVIEAKSSGIVNAKYVAVTDNYGITISSILNANGVAKVTLAAGDHKITIPTVICYVNVNPVADAPTVKDDTYEVVQDSLNTVTAKLGVLANDANPDSVSVVAVLKVAPEHGSLTLNEDGSFTFDAEANYLGDDAFGYVIAYGESDTTDMAIVSLTVVYKNQAPTIVDGVIDTVGSRLAELTEDYTGAKKYTKAEVISWFTDDSTAASDLKFSVTSMDSLLNPSFTTAGVLQVASVKNACGEDTVIVTAKDKQGATVELKIPATIACVNDKPVVAMAIDTVYIPADGWETQVIDLAGLFSDPDGDTLEYAVTDNASFKRVMSFEVDSTALTLSMLEDALLNDGETYNLSVKASDPAGTYASAKIFLIVGEAPADTTESIAPTIAKAKLNWQGAIQGTRGSVTLMDMQGRVMWTRRLPVSESEVRNASANVQGRKILRVNRQVYTIK